MNTSEVLKWSPAQWYDKVKFAKPSGGGAIGVVFCWCQTPNPFYSGGTDYNNPRTADFVIKPIQGSAATVRFAEHMMKHTIGALTLHTKPINRATPHGAAVMYTILKFRNAAQTGTPQRKRWDSVWNHVSNAQAYLVQETLNSGVLEFGDEAYNGGNGQGLRYLLRDQPLMKNLGLLFAVDAILGNGDRLCKPNTGNIMYNCWNGMVWAVDSTTVLTNYRELVNDPSYNSWPEWGEKPTANSWAKAIVSDSPSAIPTTKHTPITPPAFAMQMLFDPDTWWTDVFRKHLLEGLQRAEKECLAKHTPPPVPPRPGEWDQAREWFKSGVEEGMTAIDNKLSGFNWLGVKSKYKEYVKRFGGDPNLDWTNFKLRRKYFKLRRGGMSNEQAISAVQSYARHKA